MLITLVVAAILLTVAVPNLRTFVQNSEVSSTADSFLAAIQQARSEAITRGDAVLLCRTADSSTDNCGTSSDEDWTSGYLMYAIKNFAGQVNYNSGSANHELIRRGPPAPGGVRVTSDSDGNHWLAFAPDGTLSESGPAAYAVCDERGVKAGRLIVIPMLGRPYISKDLTAAPNCKPS